MVYLHVIDELTQQWSPQAIITASNASFQCIALALQYEDCCVIHLRQSDPLDTKEDPETDDTKSTYPELVLEGPMGHVTAIQMFPLPDAFSCLLCTSSSERIILWRVSLFSHATKSVMMENPVVEPSCMAFDNTGTLLAVGLGTITQVIIINKKSILISLEGHLAPITLIKFHSCKHHILITCSEDRTFKLWDLAKRELLFQSFVLSSRPIVSLDVNNVTGDIAVGFTDGIIRVFGLSDNYAKELAVVNLEQFIRKLIQQKKSHELSNNEAPLTISSLPEWARDGSSQNQIDSECTQNTVTMEYPVFSLHYFALEKNNSINTKTGNIFEPATNFSAHGEEHLIDHSQVLVAGLPSALLAVNAMTYEVSLIHDFQNKINNKIQPITIAKAFFMGQFAGETDMYDKSNKNGIMFGVISAFQSCVTVLRIYPSLSNTKIDENNTGDSTQGRCKSQDPLAQRQRGFTSVVPHKPPPENSVLNLPPLPLKSAKSTSHLDKPITFKSRIKSSGYGAKPPYGVKNASATLPLISSCPSVKRYLKSEYPIDCGLLDCFQPRNSPNDTIQRNLPAVPHIEFSNDGNWLATCGTDGVAQACKLPLSKYKSDCNHKFIGHNSSINSIHWSSTNQMLLTTSTDTTSRLWLIDSEASPLSLTGAHQNHPVTRSSPWKTNQISRFSTLKKKTSREPIVDALFFYRDQFILSASKNIIRLHQFSVDRNYGKSVIKSKGNARVKSSHRQKRPELDINDNRSAKKNVAQWAYDDFQSLTAITCANSSTLSSIVVSAGSDRSIRIRDVALDQTTRVIPAAHSRAVQSLCLPQMTCFVSHPSNFYDLLLSSAPLSGLYLWDIRMDNNRVMRFSEHQNRVHQIGMAFSPCMRYISCGSEDRQAYIYDIRTGRTLRKLSGHTDIVSSVAFNPLYPQLATASYDGTIRFYTDKKDN